MRSLFVLGVCICALGAATIGCNDDGGTGGSGGTAGTGGSGGTAGTGGGGSGGEGGMAGGAGTGGVGGGGGIAPVVERIDWAWVQPCNPSEVGDLTVTVTATDEDTDPANLTYSGQVGTTNEATCTDITAAETTVTCQVHLGLRQGTPVVTDPEGNQGSLDFNFDPCTDGSVCEGGAVCE